MPLAADARRIAQKQNFVDAKTRRQRNRVTGRDEFSLPHPPQMDLDTFADQSVDTLVCYQGQQNINDISTKDIPDYVIETHSILSENIAIIIDALMRIEGATAVMDEMHNITIESAQALGEVCQSVAESREVWRATREAVNSVWDGQDEILQTLDYVREVIENQKQLELGSSSATETGPISPGKDTDDLSEKIANLVVEKIRSKFEELEQNLHRRVEELLDQKLKATTSDLTMKIADIVTPDPAAFAQSIAQYGKSKRYSLMDSLCYSVQENPQGAGLDISFGTPFACKSQPRSKITTPMNTELHPPSNET